MFELHDFQEASFVTLTYNEENYPKNGSLNKAFLQEFYDELQHKYKYHTGKKLRFFSCGEYGEHTHRAHYHGIIYGLNPNPYDKNNRDRELIASSWHYCDKEMFVWRQHDFNKNAINFVNRETIQYVAGYVQKKLRSYQSEYYDKLGIEAPFKIMSKGLGLNYAKENERQLKECGFTWYNGHKVRIPRYFREKLGIEKSFEETEAETNLLVLKSRKYSTFNCSTTEMMRFNAWLASKNVPLSKVKGIENADLRERLFSHWLELQEQELADIAEREFLKVHSMHRGAL